MKTEIGMARAFVRLSLEKKCLAEHLRQLLNERDLLKAFYKQHAFLRQEDEREQFLFHLQSLNVVDYFCFTNYFKSIRKFTSLLIFQPIGFEFETVWIEATDYSILIVPNKQRLNSSSTSANPYMKLYGTLGESGLIQVRKNLLEFSISVSWFQNLLISPQFNLFF